MTSIGKNMEKLEPLCTVDGSVKFLKIEFSYDPAILLLRVYAKELKARTGKDI